jgi:hypothetical protein
MVHVVRLVLFLLVNVAGWFVIPLVINLAHIMNVYPDLPEDLLHTFAILLLVAGPWVWVAAALASVGYFFTRGELHIWLLLAPMYVPLVYSVLVITYFNFVKFS